jgi:putative chitinase
MDLPAFYNRVRAKVGKLSTEQVAGLEAVLAAAKGAPLAHAAYMLATAWHETNATMQPVREAYWLSEEWRRKNLRYWPFYGRGYVQLTWEGNYRRADEELDLGGTLLAKLDRAMEPAIAAAIMRRGMAEGWFSKGATLARYLPDKGPATAPQYRQARRIINGLDAADKVAAYAIWFEGALAQGAWA